MALCTPSVGSAQGFSVTGEVLRGSQQDSVPVINRDVFLHEITMSGGSAIDSTRTDRQGRYRLTAEILDTTATYLVSVEHEGIGYFSQPIRAATDAATAASTLVVFDTSSSEPTIHLAERHIIIRAPEPDGLRRVIELIALENRGALTRMAPDTSTPVWEGPLPEHALQFEVGESDVNPDAVYRRGDRMAVAAPVTPGVKQILVGYQLSASRPDLSISVEEPVGRFNLLLEDTTASVDAVQLQFRGAEPFEDIVFYRYSGEDLPTGTRVGIAFESPPFSIERLWWLVVPVVALVLAGGLWRWLRQVPHTAPAATPADRLAADIAALDAAFERRPGEPSVAEREAYERRRAELKGELSRALATDRSDG